MVIWLNETNQTNETDQENPYIRPVNFGAIAEFPEA